MSRRWQWMGVVGLLAASLGGPASAAEAGPLEFHVVFDRAVSTEPFTGRVYVLLSQSEHEEPPAGPNWFNPEPFFAVDVKDWKPGEVADRRRRRPRLSRFRCRKLPGGRLLRPGRDGLRPRRPQLRRRRGQRLQQARPRRPRPQDQQARRPDHRPGLPRQAVRRDGARQAGRCREQAADGVPRPADAAAGRRRAAAVVLHQTRRDAIRSCTKSPASAARTSGLSARPRAMRRTWPASRCSRSCWTRAAGSATTSSPTRRTTARAAGRWSRS